MPRLTDEDAIKLAATLVSEADSLIVAAGAGIGIDSGLPDFRGKNGFWKAYPALSRSGIDFYQIASPASFKSTPSQAWGFYGHRLALYRRTVPHAGFALLKKWGQAKPHGYWVYTSNVDGQFQKAGFDPLRIMECHGSIHHLQCTQPCSELTWSADDIEPVVDESRCQLQSPLPLCPHCGALARPNILMFDDWQWVDERRQIQEARQRRWLSYVQKPVVIEIGAGTNIATVRHFSHRVMREQQGKLVRINPDDAKIGTVPGVSLPMGALQALDAIDAALGAHDKTA